MKASLTPVLTAKCQIFFIMENTRGYTREFGTAVEQFDGMNLNDSLSANVPVNDTSSSKGTASPSKSLSSSTSTSAENVSQSHVQLHDSKVHSIYTSFTTTSTKGCKCYNEENFRIVTTSRIQYTI